MRRGTKRQALSLAAAAGVLGLLAMTPQISAAHSAAHTASASLPTMNSAMNFGDVWVKTLDPATPSDSLSIDTINLIDANLVQTSYPSLRIIPQLATWTVSSNHKVYTFHIRSNARFSNGDPVTAQDAAWSLTRTLMPATKSSVAMTYLGEIVGADAVNSGKAKKLAGVKVINNKTLQITVKDPVAYFLGALSYPTGDILDKRIAQGKTSGQLTNSCGLNVGAGPFKLACRSNASDKSSFFPNGHSPYMRFTPNPYYYGSKPKFNIYAPFFGTLDEEYKAWEGKQLDWTQVPTPDLGSAKSKAGFKLVPQLSTDYITPNQKMAPFNNVHCRLAVAYAIDRVGITTKLLHGTEGPLYGVVPPGLGGYLNKESGLPSYDPARARKELAQCSSGIHNVTMTYQHTTSDIDHEYDAVRANLAAIGADITLKPLTFNAWLNIVTQPMTTTKTQITENLWIDDYPDPQDWLQNLLQTGASYDIGSFSNPTFDKLVNQGNVTFNEKRRAQIYQEASRIAVKDGAWIGVGYQVLPVIINPTIHNMVFYSNTIWPRNADWGSVTISK